MFATSMTRVISLMILFASLMAIVIALPQQHRSRRPVPVFKKSFGLDLPANATLIRENIVDNFTCDERIYGYYADMENECQIFHVCLPTARGSMKWSFICPEETVFNQATFVCTRTESSIPCEDSEKYYNLNEEIGKDEENEIDDDTTGVPIDAEIDETVRPVPKPRKLELSSRKRQAMVSRY